MTMKCKIHKVRKVNTVLFNESFIENNQKSNELLYITEAGMLHKDKKYAIEREKSPTNVIGYVLSGTLHVTIYNKRYQVYSNTCYIMPHDTKYKIFSDPDLPCEMLWMNIRGKLFNSMCDTLFQEKQMIVANFNIEEIYIKITMYMTQKEDCTNSIRKEVTNLLFDIQENIHKPKAYENRKAIESRSISMERYIMNRIQYEFSVPEMAKYFHLSTDQLNRIFKKEFETTPYQYYQKIRIDLVKSLLLNTELSMEEISDRLGFSNRNNFSARFKAITGFSPVRYKKERKASNN